MRGHGAHSDRPQTELHVHVYMSPVTKRTLARLPPGRIRSHHHIRVPLTHPPTHVQLCLCQVPMSRAHAAMSTQVHVSGSMQHVPTLVAVRSGRKPPFPPVSFRLLPSDPAGLCRILRRAPQQRPRRYSGASSS